MKIGEKNLRKKESKERQRDGSFDKEKERQTTSKCKTIKKKKTVRNIDSIP